MVSVQVCYDMLSYLNTSPVQGAQPSEGASKSCRIVCKSSVGHSIHHGGGSRAGAF